MQPDDNVWVKKGDLLGYQTKLTRYITWTERTDFLDGLFAQSTNNANFKP